MVAEPELIRSKDDVIRAINESTEVPHRSRMIGIIALGGFFLDAYDFTSLSAGATQLQRDFGLSASELGFVTAAMAGGAVIGALSGGYFVDRFGRLRMFVINLVLFVLATIGAAFAPDYGVLIALRLLIGIGVGLDVPVAMAFLAEFMALNRKARWAQSAAALWSTATICGLLVALALYGLGAGDSLWRWAIGLGAVPAVVILVLRFRYMSESPMWAATKGDLEGAARILSAMYRRPFAVAPGARGAGGDSADVSPWRMLRALFSPEFRGRTILISIVSAAQSVQFSSVGFYLPLIVYSFFRAGYEVSLWSSVFANSCGLIAAVVSAAYADRLGFRTLTIAGFCGVGAVLIVLGLGGSAIPAALGVVLLALFIGAHTFGPGSTAQSMSALSYPTSVRGSGAGLSQACNRTGSLIALYALPVLLSAVGLYHAMLVLLAAPLIGLIALAIIKWEPAGKVFESQSPLGLADGSEPAPAAAETS
jgi:putative MFS transporter